MESGEDEELDMKQQEERSSESEIEDDLDLSENSMNEKVLRFANEIVPS